jgi:predicted  nucleic acid-binding Zn-ribbon protein
MNHKCLNCGKEFETPSARRKTCSDACRKRYQRNGESLQQSYNGIMRQLNQINRLIKSHPHMRPQIAETLAGLKSQINYIERLAGSAEQIAATDMLEGMRRGRL